METRSRRFPLITGRYPKSFGMDKYENKYKAVF